MSTKWTDVSSFASIPAGTVATDDVLPFADVSQAEGSQQRVITVDTLAAVLNGVVGVNSYAVPTTLDTSTDRGHHVRITAAAAVTIPPDLPIGWNCVLENATVSDTVSLAAGAGVTILSAGTEVANGKWVAIVMVNTNVASVVGSFADEAAVPVSINTQTGTTYTLVLADAGKLVTLENAGAITLTVPTNASVAFPVGTVVDCAQLGAGLVTTVGATGVTINGVTPGSKASAGQWSGWRLVKLATDTWLATGELA